MALFGGNNPSATTPSSESLASTTTTLSKRLYASKDWVEKTGYIDLLFSDMAECDEFVEAYGDAYNPSIAGSTVASLVIEYV